MLVGSTALIVYRTLPLMSHDHVQARQQQRCLLLVQQSSKLQAVRMKTMAMQQGKAGSSNSRQWRQEGQEGRRGCKIILLEPVCRVRLCSSARSSQECWPAGSPQLWQSHPGPHTLSPFAPACLASKLSAGRVVVSISKPEAGCRAAGSMHCI